LVVLAPLVSSAAIRVPQKAHWVAERVSWDTDQEDKSLLKELAPLNMCFTLVTEPVCQASGWSKEVAPCSKDSVVVTDDVSQSSGWLKAVESRNTEFMLVTDEVSNGTA
jgi:hypothetical protein